jgi:hypothetical protein
MKRREFFTHTLAATSLLLVPGFARARVPLFDEPLINPAPMEQLTALKGSPIVEGDTPDEAHEIFWDKDGYVRKKGGMPVAREHFDAVVVGGGISGISAAYQLRGKKVLLLEGNPRFGGNSRSQTFSKTSVNQGAAYIANFEAGDDVDQFLGSLGINKNFRKTSEKDEVVTLNGKFYSDFWKGTTDPQRSDEFIRARQKLKDVWENTYPDMPIWNSSSSHRQMLNGLDMIPFSKWLEREIGTLHPHVMEYITVYCWSSFAASPNEISAAQGLSFLASDLEETRVFPGGNGFIAQAIYQQLLNQPQTKLRSLCFAVDIRSLGGKAQVCFRNEKNELETVTANDCIVASPKLVAKHIISSLDQVQRKAMDDVTYRAYLVANLFLNKKVPSPGYDVFSLLGADYSDPYENTKKRTFTDVTMADWAGGDRVDQTTMTLFLPLPYNMAQQYLFTDDLKEKYEARLAQNFAPTLKSMGLSWGDVNGTRLVRYGHALPLARTGLIANGAYERASATIDGCIHFANQDNWGNPCFETSFGSALRVCQGL